MSFEDLSGAGFFVSSPKHHFSTNKQQAQQAFTVFPPFYHPLGVRRARYETQTSKEDRAREAAEGSQCLLEETSRQASGVSAAEASTHCFSLGREVSPQCCFLSAPQPSPQALLGGSPGKDKEHRPSIKTDLCLRARPSPQLVGVRGPLPSSPWAHLHPCCQRNAAP